MYCTCVWRVRAALSFCSARSALCTLLYSTLLIAHPVNYCSLILFASLFSLLFSPHAAPLAGNSVSSVFSVSASPMLRVRRPVVPSPAAFLLTPLTWQPLVCALRSSPRACLLRNATRAPCLCSFPFPFLGVLSNRIRVHYTCVIATLRV